MAKTENRKRQKKYSLVLTDNDREKELGKVSFSKGAAAGILATVCALVVAIFISIFAIIPARNAALESENSVKTDSLEAAILRWRLYSENLKAVLSSQQTVALDTAQQDSLLEALVNEISQNQ